MSVDFDYEPLYEAAQEEWHKTSDEEAPSAWLDAQVERMIDALDAEFHARYEGSDHE